jgi:hypothetical protein
MFLNENKTKNDLQFVGFKKHVRKFRIMQYYVITKYELYVNIST